MVLRKVLMLHGYSQNAAMFSKRMGAIRKACGKDIDFVFLDAPHILQPVDIGSSLSDLSAPEASSSSGDPADIPRAWWKSNAEKTKCFGMEETLDVLKGALSRERYDGVFGFSQGAALAAFLSALLERPHLYQPFLTNGQPPHPPMKFCVAVSGFKIRDPLWAEIMSPTYSTPTLHVAGTNDVIVVHERTQMLLDVSANKRVEYHDGGHFVPSKASFRNFFRDYLRDPFGDIPSPGSAPGASLEPPSGIATPVEVNSMASTAHRL
ncbi:FSH1-domain-containing protein [Rickenella mellea]|uniref:FSH1-domain-containing protein n=1 Tax=Rickenella mellea TaxID=50990 RepID=A0A4Y7Q7J9_9AGAM|nr:FSH1-domain-containing protein [Rickenella mellea]